MCLYFRTDKIYNIISLVNNSFVNRELIDV